MTLPVSPEEREDVEAVARAIYDAANAYSYVGRYQRETGYSDTLMDGDFDLVALAQAALDCLKSRNRYPRTE